MEDYNSNSLNPGDTFGQYKVIQLLGQGGMGQVYEMEHEVLQTRHAFKLINQHMLEYEESLQYFRNEARVMANLRHPGLVTVDDFGQTDGNYWLRQELIPGIKVEGETIVSLDEYLESRNNRVHECEVLEFLKQTLEAIGYAHSKGVIHCDLKPANILLHPSGMKIADFGIVRLIREDWLHSEIEPVVKETRSNSQAQLDPTQSAIVGTYEYMSPEQRKGLPVDERSDLFSIGLTAYQMLTGRENPGLKRASEIQKGIHPNWDRWLEKSVEESPTDRFTNARDMLTSMPKIRPPTWFRKAEMANTLFVKCQDGDGNAGEPPAKDKDKKSIFVMALGMLALLALILSGAWLVKNLPEDNPKTRKTVKQPPAIHLPNPPPSTRPDHQSPAPPIPIPPEKKPAIQDPPDIRPDPGSPAPPIPLQPTPLPLARLNPPTLPHKTTHSPMVGKPFTVEDVGIQLHWIPPGKFQMGSPDKEPSRFAHEGPQHQVTLTQGFWIGNTEVTVGQWNLLSNPSQNLKGGEDMPVHSVTWSEASHFCERLNQRGAKPPEPYKFRLPTEAEWEYACRAGTQTPYFFGPDPRLLQNHSWYGKNGNGVVHPAGLQSFNNFGLYDMHGNVREWCQDYLAEYSANIAINPSGPKEGLFRVTRGGSWQLFEPYCRSAARKGERPSTKAPDLGFRVALAPILRP